MEIRIDGTRLYKVEEGGDRLLVNGKELSPDIVRLDERSFHVLLDNRSYHVMLKSFDEASRSGQIAVNGKIHSFSVADPYERLLEQLGMSGKAGLLVRELKAPMPGLVLKILVQPGQQVQKGDKLLILEAMKMENIIKSPVDGRIASLRVQAGESVEKNEVLLEFTA